MTRTSLLVLAANAAPQIAAPEQTPAQGTSVYTGVHSEIWQYQGVRTFEGVLPVYCSADLQRLVRGLALDIVTSPMLATTGKSSAVEHFAGIAGTKVRASYNLLDAVLVTAGVQAPTGANRISAQESGPVSAVTTRPMTFSVARVSTGVDVSATVAACVDAGRDVRLGAAIGVLLHGPYVPVDGEGSFDPGNELSITAGVDKGFTLAAYTGAVVADAVITAYGSDRLNDMAVYHASPRLTLNLAPWLQSASGVVDRLSVTATVRFHNTRPTAGADRQTRAQDELLISNRLIFAKTRLAPCVIARLQLFSARDASDSQALVAGIGGGIAPHLSRRLALTAEVVVQGGRMAGGNLGGGELNVGLRYGF